MITAKDLRIRRYVHPDGSVAFKATFQFGVPFEKPPDDMDEREQREVFDRIVMDYVYGDLRAGLERLRLHCKDGIVLNEENAEVLALLDK